MRKNLKKLQEKLELNSKNKKITGICYLTGHCLNEVLLQLGYKSKKVTGHLALILNGQKKYVMYGSRDLKGFNVGDYHTWCEVDIDGEAYIVDPAIKYNRKGLIDYGIRVDKSVPDIIITNNHKDFKWIYMNDDNLEKHSLHFLEEVETWLIDIIIKSTVESFK